MSIELPPYRPIKRRNGLKVMQASIHALFMRELQTRFGNSRLGYFWALFDPGFQILIFVVLFGAILERAMLGIDYAVFLVGGMAPWFLFQKNTIRALAAVDANSGLLSYRPVRPIDTIIARLFLELIIFLTIFVVFILGLIGLGFEISYSYIDSLIMCWFTLGLFALGFALIIMVIGHYMPDLGKFISIIFTLLYFASGILYSITIVPEPYKSYLLINPVLHNLEIIRHCLSPTYPTEGVSFSYFLKSTICVLFFGLLMYQYAEKDMMRSQ